MCCARIKVVLHTLTSREIPQEGQILSMLKNSVFYLWLHNDEYHSSLFSLTRIRMCFTKVYTNLACIELGYQYKHHPHTDVSTGVLRIWFIYPPLTSYTHGNYIEGPHQCSRRTAMKQPWRIQCSTCQRADLISVLVLTSVIQNTYSLSNAESTRETLVEYCTSWSIGLRVQGVLLTVVRLIHF